MCSALDKHGHSPASLAKIDAHLLHLLPVAGSNSRSASSSHTHTSTRRCQRWLHRSNVPGNASTPDYRIHLSMQVPTRDHWKTQGDTSHSLAFPCQSQLMTKRSAFLLVDQLWAAVSSDCTVPSALSGATSGMRAR